MNNNKKLVHDFWEDSSCGENLYLKSMNKAGYINQAEERYKLEGELILPLANFSQTKDLKVLEIGVGLGADHQKFAESGALLSGIDLTNRAVEYTRHRLETFGLESNLQIGDAEKLNFTNECFDQVYSWGVIHHTPDTPKAIEEIHRVLKKSGKATIMIYHKWSMVGLMLWVRYALIGMKPWLSLKKIYSKYLESPGTKAYSIHEAQILFSKFKRVKISTALTHGDLLESNVGQKHQGFFLTIAKKLIPRKLIKYFFPQSGLFMLITAIK